jgi:hypothetical protein
MVEGFFLDGIDAEAAGATEAGHHHLAALVGTHETHAPLTFMQLAEPRTQIALHPAILQPVPVAGIDSALHGGVPGPCPSIIVYWMPVLAPLQSDRVRHT